MKVNKTVLISFVLLSAMTLLVPMAFAEKPIVQQVTGGGWFLAGTTCNPTEISKKTFGFNAEDRGDGVFTGNVQFDEHDPFGGFDHGYPHVHGYEITSLVIVGTTATIMGICRLNGDNTPRAFTVIVTDVGEPGTYDTFHIIIPSISYETQGQLGFPDNGGGNIQIHVPAPPV